MASSACKSAWACMQRVASSPGHSQFFNDARWKASLFSVHHWKTGSGLGTRLCKGYIPYSALISRNLNFADSSLQSFRWINFAVRFSTDIALALARGKFGSNQGSVDQLVRSTSVETWLRQLLLNTFFLALLVPRSYFGRIYVTRYEKRDHLG